MISFYWGTKEKMNERNINCRSFLIIHTEY